MAESFNQIIESDVQLSQRILSVSNRSFNSKNTIKMPKAFDKDGNVTEWQEKEIKDIFPNVFSEDLTVANLSEPELRAVRIGIDLFCQIVNYAYRYNRYALIEVGILVSDKVNTIVVTSRGRNMEAAKLAKTQLSQSMQEMFHKQYSEHTESPIGEKKGVWNKLWGRSK